MDPLHNLRCAVHRELQPEQALTRQEAVRALTVNAAASLDTAGGGLAPGHVADLVICDGDPFEPNTRVTQTWIAGAVAWPDAGVDRAPVTGRIGDDRVDGSAR